jgi:hypothetical protein
MIDGKCSRRAVALDRKQRSEHNPFTGSLKSICEVIELHVWPQGNAKAFERVAIEGFPSFDVRRIDTAQGICNVMVSIHGLG